MKTEVPVAETERLVLRRLRVADAGFILELVNTSGWLRFIGDRGVRNVDDAIEYLRKGPFDSYEKRGYGLWLVVRKSDSQSIGLCGILKRDTLEYPDVGFALLPQFTGNGYANEAVRAVLATGRDTFRLPIVSAITTPDNEASKKVLLRNGFSYSHGITNERGEDLSLFFKNLGVGN